MNNKNDDYAYGIDALRFLCALSVAIFHFTYRTAEGVGMMPFGWIGVQIFFVISGVVIANSANGAEPKKFLIGRFLRLYPAAWIAAIINISVLSLLPLAAFKAQGISVIPGVDAFARSVLLVGDYFLTSSYWTLPIELGFYLLVFFSIFTRGLLNLIVIARLLIVLSCPYLIAHFFHQTGFVNLPWLDLGYGLKNALLLRHGTFFAIGIYVWWFSRGFSKKPVDLVFFVFSLMLAIIEISTRTFELISYYAGQTVRLKFLLISSVTMFVIFVFAIYLSMCHRRTLRFSPGTRHALRTAGLMTYPLYLLHEALGGFMLHVTEGTMPFPVRVSVALMVACIAAYFVSAFAEPLLRRHLRALVSMLVSKPDTKRHSAIEEKNNVTTVS